MIRQMQAFKRREIFPGQEYFLVCLGKVSHIYAKGIVLWAVLE